MPDEAIYGIEAIMDGSAFEESLEDAQAAISSEMQNEDAGSCFYFISFCIRCRLPRRQLQSANECDVRSQLNRKHKVKRVTPFVKTQRASQGRGGTEDGAMA